MPEIEQQIEEMYGALLCAFTSARQFDTPLHTETVKDMAKYLVRKGFGKQNPWIPVTERMPDVNKTTSPCESTTVIVAEPGVKKSYPMIYERACIRGETVYRWRWMWGSVCEWNKITHWMPLPEPPEVDHDPN